MTTINFIKSNLNKNRIIALCAIATLVGCANTSNSLKFATQSKTAHEVMMTSLEDDLQGKDIFKAPGNFHFKSGLGFQVTNITTPLSDGSLGDGLVQYCKINGGVGHINLLKGKGNNFRYYCLKDEKLMFHFQEKFLGEVCHGGNVFCTKKYNINLIEINGKIDKNSKEIITLQLRTIFDYKEAESTIQ